MSQPLRFRVHKRGETWWVYDPHMENWHVVRFLPDGFAHCLVSAFLIDPGNGTPRPRGQLRRGIESALAEHVEHVDPHTGARS